MEKEHNQENKEEMATQEEINDLIKRTTEAENTTMQLTQAMTSLSGEKQDANFLHHQISTQELLEKLEHFYRGDFQTENELGEVIWKKQEDTDLITFNEYGVTSLMEILAKYIDKNTMLSNYTEQRIYEILTYLGNDLILFILCNYEKIGMDTHFKKTKFRLIITTTLHTIESCYRRSIGGKTMEELNQSKVVGQFGNQEAPMLPAQRNLNPVQKFLGFK